jgi:UDP-glucose 4-epimerase
MGEDNVVLVTGVAGYWGSRVAARLLAAGTYHVLGLDAKRPDPEMQGLDVVQADVRNPALGEFLQAEGVDTICHLAFIETERPSGHTFDANVMGTTRLLDACAQAGVHKVVLKSSTAVYGARPSNSAFLTEEQALRGSRQSGTIRDLVEIERYCEGFRHQAPEMVLTILRFANIVGPTADTPMTRFLLERRAPALLGFDPVMQVVHEDDVEGALVHAVQNDVPGAYNVAAEGPLPLSKMRGLAGKRPFSILHPFAYWRSKLRVGRSLPEMCLPFMDPDYLRYRWVGDLSRMRDALGFEPEHTAEDTLGEFAGRYQGAYIPSNSELLAQREDRLREIIEQRRRARKRQPVVPSGAKEGGDDE